MLQSNCIDSFYQCGSLWSDWKGQAGLDGPPPGIIFLTWRHQKLDLFVPFYFSSINYYQWYSPKFLSFCHIANLYDARIYLLISLYNSLCNQLIGLIGGTFGLLTGFSLLRSCVHEKSWLEILKPICNLFLLSGVEILYFVLRCLTRSLKPRHTKKIWLVCSAAGLIIDFLFFRLLFPTRSLKLRRTEIFICVFEICFFFFSLVNNELWLVGWPVIIVIDFTRRWSYI